MTRRRLGTLTWVAILSFAATLMAQNQAPVPGGLGQLGNLQKPPLGSLSDPRGGSFGLGGFGEPHVKLSASIELLKTDPAVGKLHIDADVADGWHMYSVTQAEGGPNRTVITVNPGPVQVTGDFTASEDPETKYYEAWEGLAVEEHKGKVRWSAPISVAAGADPQSLQAAVDVLGQVCSNACETVDETLTAKFAGYYQPPRPSGAFASPVLRAKIEAYAEPATVAPGGQVKLHFRATPDEGWHIYGLAPMHDGEGNRETLIALSKRHGWKASVKESRPPVQKTSGDKPYHEQAVVWTLTLDVPSDAEKKVHTLAGYMGFQTCDANSCMPPTGAKFEVDVRVAEGPAEGKAPMLFSAAKYADAEKWAARAPVQKPLSLAELGIIVLLGMCGGLILNLMPCVLPVIGLKVLSFVEQAGQSRWATLKLNLWYSAGLISVFLVLATLATTLNMGWGEQFTYTWFKVAMIGLVFGMALSFLGIWEIPMPGFAGAGKSQELQDKEGPGGAFFKGVFTTILATPCSGPFLGALFAYTLSQPPLVIYMIFLSIGLGMASPFLLAGAFPVLVNWLPRPGAWMEYFKNLMGFVLLGTVVFQFSTIKPEYFIPTMAMIMGIWFACWMVGQARYTTKFDYKIRTWGGAAVVIALSAWASFTYLTPHEKVLPWQPYSPAALAAAQAEGKTVLVEYTAAWCLNCKLNMRFAVDTQSVKELVDEYDVVPLLADWSDRSPEIKSSLAELNAVSIPLLAVYPGGRPEDVIVLRDLLKETQVLQAIKEAGPSENSDTAVAQNVSSRR